MAIQQNGAGLSGPVLSAGSLKAKNATLRNNSLPQTLGRYQKVTRKMAGRTKSGRKTASVKTKEVVFVVRAYRRRKTKSPAWDFSQAGDQMKTLSEA
jgi:hypothetical protein